MPGRGFSAGRETVLGLGVYAAVLLVGKVATSENGQRQALRNARRILRLEQSLGLDQVYSLHRACVRHRRLVKILHSAYMGMNFGLTVGWLMRLYRRQDPQFHRFRRAAVLSTLAAQPVSLLFPCAPPRKLEGFEDTGIKVGGIDFESRAVSQLYNPLAAMPSVHVIMATVAAAAIDETAHSRLTRRLARGNPAAVTLVVIATGNHFVLDTIVGRWFGRHALRLAKGMKW